MPRWDQIVLMCGKRLFSTKNTPTNIDATGWLAYDNAQPFPAPASTTELYALDDMTLVPFDQEPLLEPVDQTITMNIDIGKGTDGLSQ